ncbi:MAG TPA: ABC transporter permease [Acidimicrobiia bacterium]|nr:ABC transporter permease [Acidimicrobiia bacterium]
MTTITTSPVTTAGDRGTRAAHGPGAGFLTATAQTARRTILQYARTPQLLVLPTIMGALFLFIFRYIFGGAINTSSVDYVDFLVPGFLVTVVLWTGMNAPAGVAEDANTGVHDRLRSLPIPRAAVVTGRSLADSALVAWVLVVTALLGYAVGFNTHADFGSVVLAFAVMLAADYAFTWVFISLGLAAGNAQAAQGMSSILVVPFTFLSGAYVPVHSMPGWMQPFAKNQPVSVIINAVRSLMLGGSDAAGVGHSTTYWVLLSLAWCVGILAVFATISVARFSRTR